MPLTAKQQRFVEEFLLDGNATQAAIRAGYKAKAAAVTGSENLRKPNIAKAIEAGRAALAEKVEITKERIVDELRKIAFYDVRKAVQWGRSPIDTKSTKANPNGLGIYPVELTPSDELDADTAAAVSEVSLTQNGIKVKMYDKRGALMDLAKILGYAVEKHEHTGPDGGPVQVAGIEWTVADPTASNPEDVSPAPGA